MNFVDFYRLLHEKERERWCGRRDEERHALRVGRRRGERDLQ